VAEVAATLTRMRPLLGTFVTIRVAVGEGDAAQASALAAVEQAFARIAAIERCMSFQDPASDLSRLNHDAFGAAQPVCSSLRRVLRAALALAAASAGRFDPTVAGHEVAAGRLPAPDGAGVDATADWRDVEVQRDGCVRFRKRLWLDLGGIAKGYAVDEALRLLQRAGLAAGMVNAGGDLRSFGQLETVSVRDPASPGRALRLLELRDAAAATSAGYFGGGFGDREHEVSATVCAPRAIWADALTKVVLAAPDDAGPVLARLGAHAMLLYRDGTRRALA
jgi:thiamine biosynthesis lipoprotein